MGARSTNPKIRLAVAAALSGAATFNTLPVMAAADSSDSLAEIIVTARKRVENLQDVPQSIDVFTAKSIEDLAIVRFEDFATRTPSMSFISTGPGTQYMFMRGVSDGSNPNVSNTSSTGFFVDDLSMAYYGSLPDLHLYDVAQIEVLNGPQGTLFGAGAMSGAIRITTAKPDMNAFSAGVDFDGGRIDGGGNNWSYEAYMNLPLIAGRTAIRVSAYSVFDGGFINNVLATRQWVNGTTSTNAAWAGKNYNTQNIEGGRVAIKQVFNDEWYATLTGGYQSQKHKGAWDQDPTNFGERNVARFGPEYGNNYIKTLDLHVEGDAGIGDLVYASTYWSQPSKSTYEYSNYVQYSTGTSFTPAFIQSFTCLTDPVNSASGVYSGCNVPYQYVVYDNKTERWSNELRLQSKPGGRVHWLGGLYWQRTSEKYAFFQVYPGLQPTGDAYQAEIAYYNNLYAPNVASPLPNEWYSYKSRSDFLQTTEFADVTFDLTDKLSIDVGTQHLQSNFSNSSAYAGYFWDPKLPTYDQGGYNRWNSKAAVNYKVSKELLLYASFAQGFRDGGNNASLGPSCYKNGAPHIYQPDYLNSFEVGWKDTLLGGHMIWNGAAYYMDWRDYQTAIFDLNICPNSFNANLGKARIYGSETNVDWKVNDALSLQVSASYSDSHLITKVYNDPSYTVEVGERLPYVPYFNYTTNIRYTQPLGPRFKGFAQYDLSHKGDMWSDLRTVDRHGFGRVLQPAYDISNLRFGVEGPADVWSVEMYVSNLLNKRAIIFVNTGDYDHRETTNTPRVLGMRLSYKFGKGE